MIKMNSILIGLSLLISAAVAHSDEPERIETRIEAIAGKLNETNAYLTNKTKTSDRFAGLIKEAVDDKGHSKGSHGNLFVLNALTHGIVLAEHYGVLRKNQKSVTEKLGKPESIAKTRLWLNPFQGLRSEWAAEFPFGEVWRYKDFDVWLMNGIVTGLTPRLEYFEKYLIATKTILTPDDLKLFENALREAQH